MVRFDTTLAEDQRGRVYLPIDFEPDEVWGSKPRHHVHGTVNDMGIRGPIARFETGHGLVLGAAWRRGCGLAAGDRVSVVLNPEGPQRQDLAEDLAAALAASPAAAAFFDGLAQFYRNAYLRWIDSTKRDPNKRRDRIAQVVELLEEGIKQRSG